MYKDSLNKLRAELFASNEEEAISKKPKGLISARVESKPMEEAKINPYSDWLKTISSIASELRETATPSKESSFAAGFAEGLTKEKDTETPVVHPDPAKNVPEGNREALIRRRGDGPSYYAPRPSKADSFKDLIDKHEGGGDYDTLFNFSNREGKAFSGVKVSQMTIGELKEFANGEYGAWSKEKLGYKATPMGRYQFVGSTLASVAKQMGLPDDTVFSPEVQDQMFDFWVGETLKRGKSVDDKVALLRGQWEGFKNVDTPTLANLVMKYGA